MDPLGIARWQFGITTVYHFLFVPITIGMAFFIAITETAWVRTRNPIYLRAAKFWGKIFLINFAMGVVTGIVQEFQFGMNWSSYSRFVGDVFGAPLAMESLLAFFLESTFIGIVDLRLGQALARACTPPASGWSSIGTMMSAFFILAANSFMQHPVGITVNADRSRAEMNDIWAVLTQPLNMWAYSHVIAGAVLQRGGDVRRHLVVLPDEAAGRAAVPQVGAVRPGRHADRRGRHADHHRRPAGQGDDRGPADEDGVRRGAVGRPARRASFSLFTIGTPGRVDARSSRSGCPACCRSWPRRSFAGTSRASTTSRPSSRRSTVPATTGRTSR